MYKAKISSKSIEIDANADGFVVDGKPFPWDLIKVSEGYFHVLVNNQSYKAEIVKIDLVAKSFLVKVNGKTYPVEVKDKFDLLLEKMGMNTQSSGKVNVIKAPMPGLIIDMKVKVGDRVNPGDPLLILEAMKMENIIKSPGEGIVKSVKAKKGESVEKNQVLIEF